VAGEVTAGNDALADDPAKVNADPEGEGWFFKLKIADKGEFAKLMTRSAICGIRERPLIACVIIR
jgi:glycine cleavage system H protein